MNGYKLLLQWLGFRRDRLRSYEVAVLTAVGNELAINARELFREQIVEVNRIQRHSQDKQVNLYRMRFGCSARPSGFGFPNQVEESLLARVRLKSKDAASEIVADVWIVQGYVFSIQFDKPPSGTLSTECLITNCEVFTDVMQQHESVERESTMAVTNEGVLQELAREFRLHNVLDCARELEQSRFIAAWGEFMPADYLSVIRETNGFVVGGWACLGVNIRQVTTSDETLLVLAEHATRGVLCTPQKQNAPGVYFYDYETDELTLMGDRFMAAITWVASDGNG